MKSEEKTNLKILEKIGKKINFHQIENNKRKYIFIFNIINIFIIFIINFFIFIFIIIKIDKLYKKIISLLSEKKNIRNEFNKKKDQK